ncbi:prepilin-type N-terminal cleavage/methylation domain-containing protein [Methylobrevis albus]|uniref:Prepilin-type N-terminal cleavage/methylation domain-containing protein n=1 Tax=Methylobrevis albus TaxID=2793297 RepID=A0A931I0E9_9HYPH|nr:prepilin-type N-terminal cleavage/methylation domain-containing protein [Methylobrevis albus]MBH0237855.1 prepilin-type N-terminal cleavage/methylation domain-containing protein [Methylobrevis albus]
MTRAAAIPPSPRPSPRPPSPGRSPRAGFTLIEALVAFTVVALLAIAAQRAVVTARSGIERTAAFTAAEQVARDLLDLSPEPGWLSAGGVSGETLGRRWTVRAEVLGLAAPPRPQGAGNGPDAGARAEWRPLRVFIRVDTGGGVLAVETVRLLDAAVVP